MDRRGFLAATAVGAVAMSGHAAEAAGEIEPLKLKGRLKHSACKWCYGKMSLEELCRGAKGIGLASVELLNEKEWDVPPKFGLTCAVAMGPTTIRDGLNRVENHDKIVAETERLLPLVKAAGIPNMIVFSGDRRGLSDTEGMSNCEKGLKRIVPLAESLGGAGVTLIMEALNSKVDHKDHMCDRTAWGFELVKRVGSERFKLLYDIYHMQIMEGDVIRTVTENLSMIAHFHTGGVPGRHEIDGSQELNYAAICKAIADKGYRRFVGQEFMPSRDPMTSLREAVEICDA